MEPNGWRTLHSLAALLALGLVPAVAAAAAKANSQAIAEERIGPTSLLLDARIDYESATLRVVGPKGYEVRKRFAGGAAIVADLLGDRAPVPIPQDGKLASALAEPVAADLEVLPDGRYHYEAIFVDAAGAQQVVSGLFFVEGGVAISREAMRARLGATRTDLAASGRAERSTVGGDRLTPLMAPSYFANDALGVTDDANDGYTFLALDSDSPVNNAYWLLFNQNGDLRIDESADNTPPGTLRMIFDRGTGDIGIGTSAPARRLHVAGSSFQLRLDSPTHGMDFDVGSAGLWFNDNDAETIVKFSHAAPGNRLVVAGTGVGIDTDAPGGNLHIFGGAGADVFNAVGPDPSIGGNALNFGYSGFTFGSGSGFFNVRPGGASVVNPALYFATGNIDRLLIDNQAFLGVHLDGVLGPGFDPVHPIHSQTSGAHLTAGGIWTNASSRELKEGIAPLAAETALAALRQLEPVSFRYKLEPGDAHVGFIAEEVPELVANPDRKTLSPMDIVAVLTRVVQEQQRTVAEQHRIVAEQQVSVEEQRRIVTEQQRTIESLARRLEELEETPD